MSVNSFVLSQDVNVFAHTIVRVEVDTSSLRCSAQDETSGPNQIFRKICVHVSGQHFMDSLELNLAEIKEFVSTYVVYKTYTNYKSILIVFSLT